MRYGHCERLIGVVSCRAYVGCGLYSVGTNDDHRPGLSRLCNIGARLFGSGEDILFSEVSIMNGFSLILYALQQLGILPFIQTFLISIAVIAGILYFIKRA